MTDNLIEIIKQALKASDAHKRASSTDELERLMAEDVAAALLSAPLADRVAFAMEIAPETAWPSELTPALNEVLGMMNFRTGPIAHLYRAAGSPIKPKCEDEQAFVLHRFAALALRHGEKWREFAEADLREAKSRLPAPPPPGKENG